MKPCKKMVDFNIPQAQLVSCFAGFSSIEAGDEEALERLMRRECETPVPEAWAGWDDGQVSRRLGFGHFFLVPTVDGSEIRRSPVDMKNTFRWLFGISSINSRNLHLMVYGR